MSMLAPGKRVVITELGKTPLESIDRFSELQVQPAPEVDALKPTDVVVEIRSAAVGWVDLIMASGQYQHVPAPPYTPGLEYSGVVAWVGADAGAAQIGDAVVVDGMIAGPRSGGDYQRAGGFARYAVVPAAALVPMPEGFSFDQACSYFGSYETAYHCLIARGRLQPGETVLIHGASGSTGLAAVHVAKHLGATVIATGRSPDKLAVVAAQGADHVVQCGDGAPRLRDQVKALTDGGGVDLVYDGVGGPISAESLRCVRFGARYLIVGWAATPFVARGGVDPNQLPTNLIMMKGVDVLGCPMVISTQKDPSLRTPRLAALREWAAAGLRPHVSHTYPIEHYREALHAKWRGDIIGAAVLHP